MIQIKYLEVIKRLINVLANELAEVEMTRTRYTFLILRKHCKDIYLVLVKRA